MDLEGIISRLSGRFEVSPKYREVGLEFLTDRFAWAVQHRTYRTLTEAVMEDELQYFYRMRGIIPIITVEGPRSVKFATDLHLFRASEVGVVDKERRHDAELFRLDRRTTERYRKGNGPLRGELTDQLGQTPQLRSYFHRPVSYDDVLSVEEVMRRYQTGQHSVTIQIGSRSMQMTPETLEDFWIMNPQFIKLRINGKLLNERLYYFWRRVENGKNGTKKDSTDGSEPAWPALFNREGRRKDVIAYLGAAATWEAVASNPKAKFIKHGALPSSELVRLGVLTAMSRRPKSELKATEATAASEASGSGSGQKPVKLIGYEVFRGYVPKDQLLAAALKGRLMRELRKGAISLDTLLELANETGILAQGKGGSVENQARRVLREMPEGYKVVELVNPNDPNPRNPTPYFGLERFLGEKGQLLRTILYQHVVNAILQKHPNYPKGAARANATRIIDIAEERGDILTLGDLEGRLSSQGMEALKGIFRVTGQSKNSARFDYFAAACADAGIYRPPAQNAQATTTGQAPTS